MICDKLVVHPQYRACGHARRMLQWGLDMMDVDGASQGVIASHMGEPVYKRLGFQVVGEITVDGDDEADGFSLRVLRYQASDSQ